MVSDRRQTRLQAYEDLRRERPASFNNPSGAPIEIIFDADVQRQASDESAKLLAERGLPPDNGDVGVVYADQYIRLVKDAVRFASGRLGTYIRIMAASDGVPAVVVPILSDGRLALVHHFRHSSREWHWEFPRGFAEPGASGETTARAELAEEVGLSATEVTLIGWLDEDSDSKVGVYLARADVPEDGRRLQGTDLDEAIDAIRLVTATELIQLVRDGGIVDSFTLSAIAFALISGYLGT